MRVPGKKEKEQIILRIAYKNEISVKQAKVIFNILGWGCFNWQIYEGNLIIYTISKYEKQIKDFHENCSKFSVCSKQVNFLPNSQKFAFMVSK